MTHDEIAAGALSPWSGSAVFTVTRADYRWLKRLLGERHTWELRKRGKRSHRNRRKGNR